MKTDEEINELGDGEGTAGQGGGDGEAPVEAVLGAAEAELDPELAELMGRLGVSLGEARGGVGEAGGAGGEDRGFAIAESRFLERRGGMKRFVKAENALVVARRVPGVGGETHCILKGDFVLGDLLGPLLDGKYCEHLRIATLGMSGYNADLLVRLKREGRFGRLTMVVSHYFEGVNRSTVFAEVQEKLAGVAEWVVMRSHAKVICMTRSGGVGEPVEDWLVVAGSANLRSSDNLEQMTIYNDREVHEFHAEWIDHVRENPPAEHRKAARMI